MARPPGVANSGRAKIRAEIDREATASNAPRVSTVQYTSKRDSRGRALATRQMRLKVDSTLLRVTSSETTSATTPAAVSWREFSARRSSEDSIARAAVGMKLENT